MWNGPPPRALLIRPSRAQSEALAACRAGKEIISEYSSDSNVTPGYNSDSFYEFDFGLDPIESESELNTTEEPLSGPVVGLVITSTHTDRFVYWPDRKPTDPTDDNSRCIAYLETLPFQEGTPLAPNEDEHTPTKIVLTVYMRIQFRLDLQADKSSVVAKGPFFPQV
jgi:hypothetical protein